MLASLGHPVVHAHHPTARQRQAPRCRGGGNKAWPTLTNEQRAAVLAIVDKQLPVVMKAIADGIVAEWEKR